MSASSAETVSAPWARRSRRRNKGFEAKREAILDAAAALMARRGYDGMSLSELAEALGVTKPTLYHYVGGKEQIFAAVVARSQAMTISMIRAIAEETASGCERLRRILVGYAKMVNSDAGARLIFSTAAGVGAEALLAIRARAREANALILQVMRDGQADGTLAIGEPEIALQTLFGALNWSADWTRTEGPVASGEIAERQAEILLGGVRPR